MPGLQQGYRDVNEQDSVRVYGKKSDFDPAADNGQAAHLQGRIAKEEGEILSFYSFLVTMIPFSFCCSKSKQTRGSVDHENFAF